MELVSIEYLREFLQSNKFDLAASQPKLCFPIIQRIHYKMMVGVSFANIHVDESLIINGHHRYICSLLLKKEIEANPWPRPSVIAQYKWNEVDVEIKDWDSIEEIKEYNKNDAQRTGCDVEIFNRLIKT